MDESPGLGRTLKLHGLGNAHAQAHAQTPAQAPAQAPIPAAAPLQVRYHFWGPKTTKKWIADVAEVQGVTEADILRHMLEWYVTGGGPLTKNFPFQT